jgi:hypothetical protein
MTFSKSDLPSLDSIRNLLLLRFLAFFCFGSDFLYEPIRLFVTHTLGGKIFFNFVPQIIHVRVQGFFTPLAECFRQTCVLPFPPEYPNRLLNHFGESGRGSSHAFIHIFDFFSSPVPSFSHWDFSPWIFELPSEFGNALSNRSAEFLPRESGFDPELFHLDVPLRPVDQALVGVLSVRARVHGLNHGLNSYSLSTIYWEGERFFLEGFFLTVPGGLPGGFLVARYLSRAESSIK